MSGENSQTKEPRLRVLMTTDTVGGVWQYCVDLLSALAQHGVEVLLATLGPPPSEEQKHQLEGIPHLRVVESEFALEWMQDPWRDVDASGEWLLGLQREFKADVIHLNGFSHGVLAWGAPVVVAAHSCVVSWWAAVHACAPGPEWDEYKRRVTEGLRASSIVVAPTHHVRREMERHYDITPTKIRVIHNFSDTEPYHADKQAYCLAAGRIWDKAKNLEMLDHVARRIHWPVRVAGNNLGPQNAETLATSVELLGPLPHDELLRHMGAASIFIHPALYEPFGLAVLEAARSKCCLVLADIPSLRELWDGAAVFIDPRDENQWAFELNRLCEDRCRREDYASRAFIRSAEYSASRALSAYLDVYRSAISAREQKNADREGVAA